MAIDGDSEDIASSLRKIANLLALQRIDGLLQKDQIAVLNAIGYSNAEAAELLGTSADTVRVTVNSAKRSKKTTAKKTAAKKTAAKKSTTSSDGN